MSSDVKRFIKHEEKENSQDEDIHSNDLVNFNTNVGLKARLYQKNKELIEKTMRRSKEQNKEDLDNDLINDLLYK